MVTTDLETIGLGAGFGAGFGEGFGAGFAKVLTTGANFGGTVGFLGGLNSVVNADLGDTVFGVTGFETAGLGATGFETTGFDETGLGAAALGAAGFATDLAVEVLAAAGLLDWVEVVLLPTMITVPPLTFELKLKLEFVEVEPLVLEPFGLPEVEPFAKAKSMSRPISGRVKAKPATQS